MASLSRRRFLKSAAALSAATYASPFFVPSSALGLDGSVAASERITMGLIGCGSHGGGWNLDLMLQNPEQQVVAVCDVDQTRLDATQAKAIDQYSRRDGATFHGCDQYGDFRDVVNRKDIDAICIATPDHWHTLMSIFAMKAGKDVICEKPTLTIREGRLLSDVQKATQRVYQTASENRSIDVYQQVVNLARNGCLGDIRRVKVLLPPGNVPDRDTSKDADRGDTARDVPSTLNYDMWLGQAPMKPFIPMRLHYNWRWNFDYSGGVITDWGSHLVNIAQWALDMDDSGPTEVQATGELLPMDAVWNTPPNFKANYRFANGVAMEIWTEVPGIKIEGTKGWILSRGWRQPLRASDEKLLQLTFEGDKNFGRPESTVKFDAPAGGEHRDFVHCVKNRKPCYYTAESGHRTHSIDHLANISMLLGGVKLQWDSKNEKFIGEHADEANKHFCCERPQRDPWTFKNVDSWLNVG